MGDSAGVEVAMLLLLIISHPAGAVTVPFVIVKLVVEALSENVQPPPEPLKVVEPIPTDAPKMVFPVVVALNKIPVVKLAVNVAVVLAEKLPPKVKMPDWVKVEVDVR